MGGPRLSGLAKVWPCRTRRSAPSNGRLPGRAGHRLAFIDECCFVHAEAKIQSSVLFETYQHFSGDKWTTQTAFTKRLKSKGFDSKAGTGNRKYFHGIGLPAKENSYG